MKAKKLLALGLLSAMAVTTMSATGVSAAESAMDGTGATDVSYKPGSSTGGDGDGNVASWTVDYPVKIVLDDATVDETSGRDILFEAVNTGTNTDYNGAATIQASLKTHAHAADNGQTIKLKNASDQVQAKVKMQLKGDAIIKTDGSSGNEFAQLKNGAASKTIKAYLKDKSGAKNHETYKTTLTWAFHSNKVN